MPSSFPVTPRLSAVAPWQEGYEEGYFQGRQQAYAARQHFKPPVRDLHVLYVTSGKGYPYSPIDDAIQTTLQGMVRRLSVTPAQGDPATEAAVCKPDVMIALDGMYLSTEQVERIRRMGIPTAVWMTDDPYYTDMTPLWATHYDYVFTLELNCVSLYESLGCKPFYLPFAAHTETFRPIHNPKLYRRDISFVGSAYAKRIQYFQPIIGRLMLNRTIFIGNGWNRMPSYRKYAKGIELNRWMGPAETAAVYNSSKMIINLHRAHDDEINKNSRRISAASPNPRTFEINACGTLQLCDERADLSSFYKPGEEIVTYRSPAELIEKAVYYLTHEEERKEIALRALDRTFREHTYTHRLDRMLTVIQP